MKVDMPKVFKSPLVILSSLLTIIFLFWTMQLTFTNTRETLSNFLYNPAPLYFIGAILALIGVSQTKLSSTMGKMLIYAALAFVSYGIANLIWGYYNIVAHIEIPYPSLADVFYLLYYPFLGIAFGYLLSILGLKITKRLMLEVVGIFIVAFALVFFIIMKPDFSLGEPVTLQVILDILYPLADVGIVTLVYIGFRLFGGKMKSTLLFFLIGMTMEVVSDILFTKASDAGSYFNGSVYDFIYIIAFYFMILGTSSIVRSFTAPVDTQTA